ncbi:GerMN domain-containing protein [Candidatus Uhrbacteria bacterium]|nr:GerMN domain-containing protein [Candidatus Uhrbacteria bacterium]
MKKNIAIIIFILGVLGVTIATIRFMEYRPAVGVSVPVQTVKEEPVPTSTKGSERIMVKAFFGNRITDPNVLHCDRVYPVERTVPKTQAVARAALEELLAGPTPIEVQKGYFTAINDRVKIQKLIIENDTAFVDFDETLEAQVGGSCRVAIIRAQIKETLKQFPTVKNVVLTINGRGEDIILQP